MSPRRHRLAVLAACLAAAVLALARARPPAPLPADAPPDRFSAGRAHAVLADLLGDQAPHPVGAPANDLVRARLLAHLRQLGLEPEEQRAFVCSEGGSCATVTNVLAWPPGQVTGPALALTAHYDSVPAGPGAADDGHGVAVVLEVLRALKDAPRRAPLVAIFTDGEEAGLLGARALGEHPRLGELGLALNIEARGTTGPGRMFETSAGNAALIAAYAAAPRPSATSLSYEIYRRLPNDTDLTILKRHGLQGMNFGFIGGVQRYHTPRDDLAHLDLGSVQHHGDSVLAAARALLADELPPPAAHNAHYLDLFGLVLLRWPAWLDLPLAALVVLVLVATGVRRRRELSARAVLFALAGPVLAVVAGVAGATALARLIDLLAGPLGPWPAAGATSLLALAAAALAAALAVLRPLARRAGPLAQALATWLGWALFALALAVLLPGASILFLAPAVLAALGPAGRLGPALAAVLAVALWAPLAPAVTEALGLSAALAGAVVGWAAGALAPTCCEEQGEKTMSYATGAILALAALAALLAARAPRVDFDHPARVNLLHLADLDAGRAWHVADAPAGLPPALADALPWDDPRALLPWSARAVPSAPAPLHDDAGPTLEPRPPGPADPPGSATLTLRARPGALAVHLVIPRAAVTALHVGGRPLDLDALRPGPSDTRLVTVHAPSPAGVDVAATSLGPASWTVVDLVAGLAPDAPAAARPDVAVPYQWGDLLAAYRVVTVEPPGR